MRAKILKWTVVTYVTFTCLVALPTYNWLYIINHSYPRWISAGFGSASVRALAWPIFIGDVRISPVARLKKAIDLTSDFEELTLGWNPHQLPPAEYWPEFRGKLLEALGEARQIDAINLDQLYPSLGEHFDAEFLRGLELTAQNPELRLDNDMVKGMSLLSLWSRWYYEHRDALVRVL